MSNRAASGRHIGKYLISLGIVNKEKATDTIQSTCRFGPVAKIGIVPNEHFRNSK